MKRSKHGLFVFPAKENPNMDNNNMGSKGGVVVRALAFHQCGPGSNPGVDAICGLSL